MCEIVLSNHACLSIHYNYIMHTKCVIYLRVNHGEGYDDVLKAQGLERIKAKAFQCNMQVIIFPF